MGYTRANEEIARLLIAGGRSHDAIPWLESALRGPVEGSTLYTRREVLRELLARARGR
jgi:hypothetical protein